MNAGIASLPWATLALLAAAPLLAADEPHGQLAARKVLLLGESPSYNVRYIDSSLQRHDALLVQTVLLARVDAQQRKRIRDGIEEFDVVLLVDVPAAAIVRDVDLTKALSQFVAAGGGLIVLASSPIAAEHPLAELLPVAADMNAVEPKTDVAAKLSRAVLTETGVKHPIMQLADDPTDNAGLWSDSLPPAFVDLSRVTARPQCDVLAVDPARRFADRSIPLVAVGLHGEGRVLYVAPSQTWRWRKAEGGRHYDRLWSQAIAHLARTRDQ